MHRPLKVDVFECHLPCDEEDDFSVDVAVIKTECVDVRCTCIDVAVVPVLWKICPSRGGGKEFSKSQKSPPSQQASGIADLSVGNECRDSISQPRITVPVAAFKQTTTN